MNRAGQTYVGSKTFLNAPEADPHDLPATADVGVVGVPFDGAVSRQPGARCGPEEIRRESGWYARNDGGFNAATGRRVDFDGVTIRDCGDAPIVTTDVEATGEGIRETVRSVADAGFPVVLGGDHYLTYPSFCGVAEEGLHVSYARDIHDEGIGPCLERAIDHATDRVDSVYLTVDIDVVDPTVAPGTGTPEFGGIDATQLLRAMERLGECDAIRAVDLVVVAPRLDPSRTTQRLGAAAVLRFLEAKFGRR